MVVRIVKNTTVDAIRLDDLSGITIPANDQIDLALSYSREELSASDNLAIYLGNGKLILNNGEEDILFPHSLDIIRDVRQFFQTTSDQKLLVSSSPKPGKTTFQLTSRIDGTANTNDRLHIAHTIFQFGQDTQGVDKRCGLFVDTGQGTEFSKYWLNSKYINFSVLGNRTYIFDGGLTWNGISTVGLVGVNLDVVPISFNPVPYAVTPGQGNSFILNNYIVIPHPTNQGTHNMPIGQTDYQTPQDLYFAEVKPSITSGQYDVPLFWTIEYNFGSKKFQNLNINTDPYNPVQDTNSGKPNVAKMVGHLFTTEITLGSFIKDLLVTGDIQGYFNLNSTDPYELGYGFRLKLDTKTYVNDIYTNTRWNMAAYIKTYRELTVGY